MGSTTTSVPDLVPAGAAALPSSVLDSWRGAGTVELVAPPPPWSVSEFMPTTQNTHAHTNEDLVSLLVSLHLHEPLGVLQAAFRQFACISVSVLFACISECACLGRFCEPNVFSRLEIALPPSRCTCGCCHAPEVSRRPTQARCNDY